MPSFPCCQRRGRVTLGKIVNILGAPFSTFGRWSGDAHFAYLFVVDEHWACFCLWAVTNHAAVDVPLIRCAAVSLLL